MKSFLWMILFCTSCAPFGDEYHPTPGHRVIYSSVLHKYADIDDPKTMREEAIARAKIHHQATIDIERVRADEQQRQAAEAAKEERLRQIYEKNEAARVQKEQEQEAEQLRQTFLAAEERKREQKECSAFLDTHCHDGTTCTTSKRGLLVGDKYLTWNVQDCVPSGKVVCTGSLPQACIKLGYELK